jgi:hypothetical protein
MTIEFAKFLIFLEICYSIYWFCSFTFIVFSYDTVSGTVYRIAGLFLGIHSLILPTAILYVINSPDRPVLILWIFVISFLYDLLELFDIAHHLDTIVIPLAWRLACAASIWAFSMSVLTLFWYIIQLSREKVKKSSIYSVQK